MSTLTFVLLLSSLCHAVTVTRVCQSTGKYAPLYKDCQGAPGDIRQRYPSNITQNGYFSSCEPIWSFGSCEVDVCAFPFQRISTDAVVDSLNDLLNNCQSTPSQGGYVNSGGYSIVQGTNVTIGLRGRNNPVLRKCTGDAATSPLTQDCQRAIDSIPAGSNVTQSSTSGCTVAATSGQCALNYCAAKGSQMNGTEYKNYAFEVLLACNLNSAKQTEGWAQVSASTTIGLYNTAQSGSSSVSVNPVCRDYSTIGGPSRSDCNAAFKQVQANYPKTITQNQVNGRCMSIGSSGGCQLDLCAPTGMQVSTDTLSGAFQYLNATCATNETIPKIGGTVGVLGTKNVTLSVTPKIIPRNVFCNSSPNNSPRLGECSSLISGIDKSKIYYQRGDSQGCTLLEKSGSCKLNFCSPLGSTITGQELIENANSILGCVSNDYVSGVYQLSSTTSVALYDPPGDNGPLLGNIVCDPHYDNYPLEADCLKAAQNLRDFKDAQWSVPPQACHVFGYESCSIQFCGDAATYPTLLVANLGLQVIEACRFLDSTGKANRTQGGVGIRDKTQGNTSVKIVNTVQQNKRSQNATGGQHDIIHRAEPGTTPAEPNVFAKRDPPEGYTPVSGTRYSVKVDYNSGKDDPLSEQEAMELVSRLSAQLRAAPPGTRFVQASLDTVAGYQGVGVRAIIAIAPENTADIAGTLNPEEFPYAANLVGARQPGMTGGIPNGDVALYDFALTASTSIPFFYGAFSFVFK